MEKGVVRADNIASTLKVPKEFVSKILQSLTESGIVYSKKGRFGGFSIAKDPAQIRLIDVVAAIDGLEMFNRCVIGFPNCSQETPCPVHDKWGELRTLAYNMLTEETLDNFKDKTLNKIKTI